MSLVDYARQYGLTLHHSLDDFDDIEFHVPPHGDLDNALEDPEGAPSFSVDFSIEHERLTVDADARALLASVLRPSRHSDFECSDASAATAKHLKLETPLLLTDPEVDLRSCKRKQAPISFGKVSFDLIEVDAEADEGPEWPQAYLRLPDEYEKASASEKLTMTREDALWLRDQLAVERPSGELDDAEEDHPERRRVLEPLTPPLSPTSLGSEKLVSFSSPLAARLAPLSVGTSPAVHLQKAVDKQLMHRDAMTSDCGSLNGSDGLTALYSPIRVEHASCSASPFRFRAAKHRLDEPLTSPTRPSKEATSSDEQPEVITHHLQEDWANLPTASEADFDELFRDTFAEGAYQVERRLTHETISDVDVKMRLLLPEVADNNCVAPWLRKSSESRLKSDSMSLISELKAMRLHKLTIGFERELLWSPLPNINLHGAITETIEDNRAIEDMIGWVEVDPSVNHETLTWKQGGLRFLDEHDSDDDEVEPAFYRMKAQPIPAEDIVPMQKRKLPAEEPQARPGSADHRLPPQSSRLRADTNGPAIRVDYRNNTATTVDREDTAPFFERPPALAKRAMSKATKPTRAAHDPAAGRTVPDLFSASSDLGCFIGLQTGQLPVPKKRKLETHAQPQGRAATAAPAAASKDTMNQETVPKFVPAMPLTPQQAVKTTSPSQYAHHNASELGLPIPDTEIPHPIIISSTLMTSHRSVITHLTTLAPDLNLIERDFAGLEKSGFTSPKSKAQSSKSSSVDSSPDILISPSTAVLISTVQKVKQKSLPGHASGQQHTDGKQGLSPLQHRILSVAQTIERVIVLVTLPTSSSSSLASARAMTATGNDAAALSLTDERDVTALASLTSWAASLASGPYGLQIEILVTSDDPAHVARWILALVAIDGGHYSSHNGNGNNGVSGDGDAELQSRDARESPAPYHLLQDETTWEIFLRRAGMNAFAAQVVLSTLKAPDDHDEANTDGNEWSAKEGQKDVYGLPAFVIMEQEERQRRFASVLGGGRVLERVGAVLDGRFGRR